jgi:hypothetical protein
MRENPTIAQLVIDGYAIRDHQVACCNASLQTFGDYPSIPFWGLQEIDQLRPVLPEATASRVGIDFPAASGAPNGARMPFP